MSYTNTPFQNSAELKKLGAPKKIVDYVVEQPGYDESRQMIIAETLGRDAYRLYAAVGSQWMDAGLQDFDADIAKVLNASVTGAALGSKTSKAKKQSSANNGKLGGRPKIKKD